MRIALISDIHANEIALQAVLADIKKVGVDQVICLGDVATLGPQPKASVELLRDLHCLCIMGNHDSFLIEPGLIHAYTHVPVIIQSVDWAREQLSVEDLNFVRTFQPRIEIALDTNLSLLLFHGSPRSNVEDILATTLPEALDGILAGYTATLMACGHTHIQMLRQHRGILVVNPGSVGMPFKEHAAGKQPTILVQAEYGIVEAKEGNIEVSLRRVPLDKEALRASVMASQDPLWPVQLQQYG
jgi:putative phosphoesterase